MPVINGKPEHAAGLTLGEYLRTAGYNVKQVVVERNLIIVPRDQLENVRIEAEDTIEILNFVGGG